MLSNTLCGNKAGGLRQELRESQEMLLERKGGKSVRALQALFQGSVHAQAQELTGLRERGNNFEKQPTLMVELLQLLSSHLKSGRGRDSRESRCFKADPGLPRSCKEQVGFG